MTCTLLLNPTYTETDREAEGHRSYKISWHIVSDDINDLPATVLLTPGLPQPGDWWIIGNDADLWAWCRANCSVKPWDSRPTDKGGEPNWHWVVEQNFSTKPPDDKQNRCQDAPIGDPLLEPQKVSGGMVKEKEEGILDRFNQPILNSAHEPIRGPHNEWDVGRGTIKIQQNVPLLQLDLMAAMANTLNDRPIWGIPARCIRLSSYTWERKFYGLCYLYYSREFEFEINAKIDPSTGLVVSNWDRRILDEGTKVLHGHWDKPTGAWVLDNIAGSAPNPSNPAHFDKFLDKKGNPATVILDGAGKPSSVVIGTGSPPVSAGSDAGTVYVQKYRMTNFLLLSVPVIF